MQRIIPNLWFDDEAEEASDFYTSTFRHGSIGRTTHYNEVSAQTSGQSAGSVMSREFVIEGCAFYALNGSFGFDFTPATSFMVKCAHRDEIDRLWDALSEGGSELMPLKDYDFSDYYGWCEDRFGVSWQLMHTPDEERHIVPCLMFVGERYGQAEDAVETYTSTFPNSSIEDIHRHGPDEAPHREGTVSFANFTVCDRPFAAMESGGEHDFDFSQAISFIIQCDDQAEIDHYWDAFTADGGQAHRFGWVTDRFGVTWQPFPHEARPLLSERDPETFRRVTEALVEMEKIDVAKLKAAAE